MRIGAPGRQVPLKAHPPVAAPGNRIGLLGGSFSPPHQAHRLISEIALRRLRLDKVWWIVTPGNPLKSSRKTMPLADRLVACRAMANDARIIVTDFEKDLPDPYTATTLDFLTARYPQTQFVWLMGADCLAQFHRWYRWHHIFASMPIAVIDRPGWRMKSNASIASHRYAKFRVPEQQAKLLPGSTTPSWTMLTGPLSPLSSTLLRANVPIPPSSTA